MLEYYAASAGNVVILKSLWRTGKFEKTEHTLAAMLAAVNGHMRAVFVLVGTGRVYPEAVNFVIENNFMKFIIHFYAWLSGFNPTIREAEAKAKLAEARKLKRG